MFEVFKMDLKMFNCEWMVMDYYGLILIVMKVVYIVVYYYENYFYNIKKGWIF